MRQRILSVLGIAAIALAFAAPSAEAQTNPFYREAVLSSAVVITADAQSTPVRGFAPATLIGGVLSCTEDSGTATLDVNLQRSLDGGTTWASIIAYTQLSATGAETKLYADVRAASAQMIGDRLRVDYNITGTGQYTCTFSLAAEN